MTNNIFSIAQNYIFHDSKITTKDKFITIAPNGTDDHLCYIFSQNMHLCVWFWSWAKFGNSGSYRLFGWLNTIITSKSPFHCIENKGGDRFRRYYNCVHVTLSQIRIPVWDSPTYWNEYWHKKLGTYIQRAKFQSDRAKQMDRPTDI